MISTAAYLEETPTRPAPSLIWCLVCGDPMERSGAGVHCPLHGAPLARVVRHPRLKGKIVEVLRRSRKDPTRYVVAPEEGERGVVSVHDLHLVAMRAFTWEEEGPTQVPSWTADNCREDG